MTAPASDAQGAAQAEIEQLRAALESRLVIGQAQGVLMERLDIDSRQAMDYLRRASNELNRKLALVAADIVRTRELPTRLTGGQESPEWQTASTLLPSVSRTNAP